MSHTADTVDLVALRSKYTAERDRRIHPDGARQYRPAADEFGYYAKDPYTPRRERQTREVLVIGSCPAAGRRCRGGHRRGRRQE